MTGIYNNIKDGEIYIIPQKVINFTLTMENGSLFNQTDYINNNIVGEKFIIKTDQLDNLSIDYIRVDYSNVRFYYNDSETLLKHKFINNQGIKFFIVEIPHSIIQNTTTQNGKKSISLNALIMNKNDSYSYNGDTSIFEFYNNFKENPNIPSSQQPVCQADIGGTCNPNNFTTINGESVLRTNAYGFTAWDIGDFLFQEIISIVNRTGDNQNQGGYFYDYNFVANKEIYNGSSPRYYYHLPWYRDVSGNITVAYSNNGTSWINQQLGNKLTTNVFMLYVLRTPSTSSFSLYFDWLNNQQKITGTNYKKIGGHIGFRHWGNQIYVSGVLSLQNPYASKDGQITLSNFAEDTDYIPDGSSNGLGSGSIIWKMPSEVLPNEEVLGVKLVEYPTQILYFNTTITFDLGSIEIRDDEAKLLVNGEAPVTLPVFGDPIMKNLGRLTIIDDPDVITDNCIRVAVKESSYELPPDYSELEDLYWNEAHDKTSNGYTSASWAAFVLIRTTAYDMFTNETAETQQQVLDMITSLRNAIDNLNTGENDSYAILTDGRKIEFHHENTSIDNFGEISGQTIIDGNGYNRSDIKEISFGDSYNDITVIPQRTLINTVNLEKLDLKGLSGVIDLGSRFLEGCTKLEQVDFSHFTNLTTVNNNLMSSCTSLNKICIGNISWENIYVTGIMGFTNVPNDSNCKIYAESLNLGNTFKNKYSNLSNWIVEIGECNKPKEPLDYTQLRDLLDLIETINPDLYVNWDELADLVNDAQNMIDNDTADSDQDILDMIDDLNEAINNLEEKYVPPTERPVTETEIPEDPGDTAPLTSNPITGINYQWTKINDEYIYVFNGTTESFNIKLLFNDIDIDIEKVRGIALQFDRLKQNGSDKKDSIIRIDKGNQHGENKAKTEIYQNNIWETLYYGSKNDLWGLELNNLKDLSFRFNCKSQNEENNTIITLRNIKLIIYYEDTTANIYEDYPMFSKYKQTNADKFYHQIKNKDGKKIWIKEPYRESYVKMRIDMDELPEKINVHTAQKYTQSSTKTQKQHWLGMTSKSPTNEMILGITDGLDQFNTVSNKFDEKTERIVKNNNRIDNKKGLIAEHDLDTMIGIILKYQKYDLITVSKAGSIRRNKDE